MFNIIGKNNKYPEVVEIIISHLRFDNKNFEFIA